MRRRDEAVELAHQPAAAPHRRHVGALVAVLAGVVGEPDGRRDGGDGQEDQAHEDSDDPRHVHARFVGTCRNPALEMLSPPSAAIVAPVMNDDSSLARNSTALAISSGRAWRSSGIIPSKIAVASSSVAPVAPTSIVCWKRLSTGPELDAVHPDALLRALLRRRPHEADERVLRGGVAEDPGRGRQAHDARVDDDRAGPVAHRRHRVLADEEGALDGRTFKSRVRLE